MCIRDSRPLRLPWSARTREVDTLGPAKRRTVPRAPLTPGRGGQAPPSANDQCVARGDARRHQPPPTQ
eukprot:7156309-Pyramimonas_sp.AAC.1